MPLKQKRSALMRFIIAALVVAGIVFLIWRATLPEPIVVSVAAVEQGVVESVVSNTRVGTVKACRRAKLSPAIGGQITRLPVRKGQAVMEGDLLLELWNKDLEAQLTMAQDAVEASRAQLHAAKLKAEVAGREAQRLMNLRQSGTASEEATDKALTQAQALQAEMEAAAAAKKRNESNLIVIQANLERTQLRAPFDGIVAEINGELHEFVTPSPVGIVMPPVVDVVDNACFYVAAPIDEVDAPRVSQGMDANITLDAFGDRIFPGRVRRVADYVLDLEKQARTVDVEVEFSHPEDADELLAGYSANVEIVLDVRQDALRVPTESILDGNRVYLYDKVHGRIEERVVETGISNWDYTEVLKGLEAGQSVVTNVDRAGVKDGAPAVLDTESP